MGADTGAVVWRRSRTIGATSTLASTVGKFLWSVLMRVFRRLQPISIVLFLAIVAFLIGFVAFSEKSPACSRLFWMNRLTLLLF